MATGDALTVGEGWISEHYFTTDSRKESFLAKALDRRKQWETDATDGSETVRTRFVSARTSLIDTYASLRENADVLPDLYERLREVLGYTGGGLAAERTGPVLRYRAPGLTEGAPLAIVEAVAVDSVDDLLRKDARTLLTAYEVDDQEQIYSVARAVSTLFVGHEPPSYVLVVAGRFLLIAERERWPEGRYLAVDLGLVCERNDDKRGGEVDRTLACVGAEALAPDADSDIWWDRVLEESVRHTVGVSKDLREGVRDSIEIIANEVVARRMATDQPPLPQVEAQPLAKQSLRFLYRILFLLFAEASPELQVLPTGAPEYANGYSLDRLRDLTLVELATPQAKHGTHLYESLAVLFRLIDQGHEPPVVETSANEGLTFRSLRADLFKPEATAFIDETKLGNEALQRVLRHLLLSKEQKGRERGFISYANLGINQLGSVYEGLMSYTGFFAETGLYEVAKGGDASKGSWVLPIERADGISPGDFVKATDEFGEEKPVRYERGAFVYRLAGRERQQSASYYTPEVLTKFTVQQALEELLDQDGETTSASDILTMTICEPALGSGAFAIEAVRQLAVAYLERRQEELDEKIDPEQYPKELQKVKAWIALHQTYGVDLNATAVELAEISLWLDTMVAGLQAPWFGLRLKRGNSLIGARRAVFRRDQVGEKDKRWLEAVPADVSLDDDATGRIHHFLVPAAGWGSAVEAKEAKTLAPEARDALRKWRSRVKSKPSRKQVDAYVELGARVERLWQLARRRLEIAEAESSRSIDVWGADALPTGGGVSREQIEGSLADENGAYRRLYRVMDAWCALWFWPLTETEVAPPTLDEWIDACRQLLGREPGVYSERQRGDTFSSVSDWEELGNAEHLDLSLANAVTADRVLEAHPWLAVCERVAEEQGFFHWELDFAPVFARGGFDLQLGNPPWVRPQEDVPALLAEGDPWWQIRGKSTQAEEKEKREQTFALPGIRDIVLDGTTDVAATKEYVSSPQHYPHLEGLQPDLYRCFMEQTWRHVSDRGMVGLIHLESHFTDEHAGLLRATTYRRLRRHWQFINELMLFEIQHQKRYGVNVYGAARDEVSFLQASSLYDPDTVARSLAHDGLGPEPGIKDEDGTWDLRPHRGRIITVTQDVLSTWHALLEGEDVPVGRTRMVYTVNRDAANVLAKLASSPRIGSTGLSFSSGWHERNARTEGYIEVGWGAPDSWEDVILQGPHLYVGTPFYKSPNSTMKNHLDWTAVDLETLATDAVPATSYKPAGGRLRYNANYTWWGDDESVPARDHYRVAWRNMAPNTGERTLVPAIIPPGAAHVHTVYCATTVDRPSELVALTGFLSSLCLDTLIRSVPKAQIMTGTLERLPIALGHPLTVHLCSRTLRLNCLTDAYGDLWGECYNPGFRDDTWTGGLDHAKRKLLGDVGPEWVAATPLRIAADRRQALVEIDALVALMLGLSADELCTVYRTQFPVLYGYDTRRDQYDTNGRLVPQEVMKVWRDKGDAITEEERTAQHPAGTTYTYKLPFQTLDREKDMRVAYEHFQGILAEREGSA